MSNDEPAAQVMTDSEIASQPIFDPHALKRFVRQMLKRRSEKDIHAKTRSILCNQHALELLEKVLEELKGIAARDNRDTIEPEDVHALLARGPTYRIPELAGMLLYVIHEKIAQGQLESFIEEVRATDQGKE